MTRALRSVYFVPAVLLSVAVAQATAAGVGHLSPWKGGGFGMFGTVDTPQYRFLSVSATDQGGQRYTVLTSAAGSGRATPWRDHVRLRVWPTRAGLSALATRLLSATGEITPAQSSPALQSSPLLDRFQAAAARRVYLELDSTPASPGVSLRHVRAGILGIQFDPVRKSITFAPIGPTVVASLAAVSRDQP